MTTTPANHPTERRLPPVTSAAAAWRDAAMLALAHADGEDQRVDAVLGAVARQMLAHADDADAAADADAADLAAANGHRVGTLHEAEAAFLAVARTLADEYAPRYGRRGWRRARTVACRALHRRMLAAGWADADTKEAPRG